MNSKNKKRFLLIGCGSIGGDKSYSVDNSKTNQVTHIHAIVEYGFCCGIVDPDVDRVKPIAEKWGVAVTLVFENLLAAKKTNPDIIVIATPQHTQYDILIDCIKYFDIHKTYILEKPCLNSLEEFSKMQTLKIIHGLSIYINYQRQHIKEYKKEFIDDKIGKVISAECVYTRGALRDGSHALAFFCDLFGRPESIKTSYKSFSDWGSEDLTRNIIFTFQDDSPEVIFRAMDGRIADIFEIDLIGEKGRLQYIDHGSVIRYTKHKDEMQFGTGYKSVGWKADELINVKLDLSHIYNDVVKGINQPDLALYRYAWVFLKKSVQD